jgi:hypothetical protein
MHYKTNVQYKPKKLGKGTLKFTVTIESDSFNETIQILNAAGHPFHILNHEFTECINKGERQFNPLRPLLEQAQE